MLFQKGEGKKKIGGKKILDADHVNGDSALWPVLHAAVFIPCNRTKLFPELAVRNIMYQVLQGLAYMHKLGTCVSMYECLFELYRGSSPAMMIALFTTFDKLNKF